MEALDPSASATNGDEGDAKTNETPQKPRKKTL